MQMNETDPTTKDAFSGKPADGAFNAGETADHEQEALTRMRNLMWTVSGDYTLDTRPDLDAFRECRFPAMYDAVKQGAFARYYDHDLLAQYMIKKMYYGASRLPLTALAQMAVDCAVYPLAVKERPGTAYIREQAFSWLLDRRYARWHATMTGRLRLVMTQGALYDRWDCEKRFRIPVEKLRSLAGTEDIMDLIRTVDELYNTLIDPHFAAEHGSLEKILDITWDEMREFNWKDFLDEDAVEELLEKYMEQVQKEVVSSDLPPQENEKRRKRKTIVQVDEAALKKMYSYIELNFGRSYLDSRQQKALNDRLCRGAHADCSLYYTDGIIEGKVLTNAQYVSAVKQMKNNQRLFLNSRHLIDRNVETMTDYLRRSLQQRTQAEQIISDRGQVVPRRLWRIGRLPDPGKLFRLTSKVNSSDFVIEVLMDASGSQRERQGQVAIQAYIISAALSNIHLPHRIMSFCTFWDYTILQRYRDFDEPPSADRKILRFNATSNNRDGLAVRAAGDELLGREEEGKILIILSDGRPNDVITNRPGSRNPRTYEGEYALRDTAFEVRRLRGQGIFVLGVFTGREKDLQAEKKIFGKDFAYVRDIRNFSRVVSAYISRILEMDTGDY